MITAKSVTELATAIAAFEPDITIALTAYNVLHGIWITLHPGATETDYQTYLQTASQTNVDTTAALLTSRGYIETPPGSGNWSKPVAA
jgi:hypothetical protein